MTDRSKQFWTGLGLVALLLSLLAAWSNSDDHDLNKPRSSETLSAAEERPAFPYQDSLRQRINSSERFEIEQYLKSEERNQKIQDLVRWAGPLIARALDKGTFGETREERFPTAPFPPFNHGRALIQTTSTFGFHLTSALVFWDRYGTINYSRSFTRLSLTNRIPIPNSEVAIYGPTKEEPYWRILTSKSGLTLGNSFNVLPADAVPTNPDQIRIRHGVVYATPMTLSDFRMLDTVAIYMMHQYMKQWFGEEQ